MNLTKKQMMVAAIVIGAVAVWYFFLRKKKIESGYDENVMIFGNENGYGPDSGAYGSYGYETGFAAWNKTKDWRKTVANPGGESGYEVTDEDRKRVAAWKAKGGFSLDDAYSTSPVAYGGTKVATAVSAPVRPAPISAPVQNVGSNEGQKCKKDHQCSPGLVCVNGRCGKKGRVEGPTNPFLMQQNLYGSERGYARMSNNSSMSICSSGERYSNGQCVPDGGAESNWWGSDWVNAVTKDLNRWSKNK